MKKVVLIFILFSLLISACGQPTTTPTTVAEVDTEVDLGPVIYTDPSQPVEARVEDLLKRMTLDEKIGQMTQVENGSLKPGDIKRYYIGSVLSGGDGAPQSNTVSAWYNMVEGYQDEALTTRLGIPLIYGVDAVHGHGILQNSTVFPHNIGLGATNNPDLVEQVARATAEEILATGIPWNFSPVVAVPQDVRWGRTYEGFSENTELVTSLGTAYIRGVQTLKSSDAASPSQSIFALATPKHFIGDGATIWASSRTGEYKLDQGNMQVPEKVWRELYLPPYQSAIDAGALSIMGSFSSWKGTKVHGRQDLLTDVLKDELAFNGFVVSDWKAIDQIYPDDYYASVVTAINAGIDMNMVPYSIDRMEWVKGPTADNDYIKFIEVMKQAVEYGDIPEARVDDAVRRILRVKFSLGLFEHPMPDASFQASVRSKAHLDLARQAVRESLVLLKNESNVLPLSKSTPVIYVAGIGANDVGLQSGGWTLVWQGSTGEDNNNDGTTILSGIRALVSAETQIEFSSEGDFTEFKSDNGSQLIADVGIVVLAEEPYAEGVGDAADISLTELEIDLLNKVREQSKSVIVILLSGRPRVITDELPLADAWVAAWLPGTEGAGVADVLFGDYPFTGKTPYSWPRSLGQLPINTNNLNDKTGCDTPLFPFGYGLVYDEASPYPDIEECH